MTRLLFNYVDGRIANFINEFFTSAPIYNQYYGKQKHNNNL